MSIRLAIPFTVLLLFATSAAAQLQQGLIRGTVLAPNGNAVEDAHVSAGVMKGSNILTEQSADTDSHGQFVFSGLALGEYRLSRSEEHTSELQSLPPRRSSDLRISGGNERIKHFDRTKCRHR